MRKRQAGQAFILVLIVLAIGALLVVPSLRLTGTALMGAPIVERQIKGLYAADAAQEYILWKLLNDVTWRSDRTEDVPYYFAFNVCDVPVTAEVIMRATEGQGGVTLATDDVIKPTKTVAVEGHPEWSDPDDPQQVNVSNGYPGPYTYIIKLEQLSSDNSKGLDSVYDVLPKGLSYIPDTSQVRVDGGAWTGDIGEPSTYTTGGQDRLRWPASGFFDEEMRLFDVRQVKEIKFQAIGSLQNDRMFYNWVLLNVEDIDTLSGPVAPIKLGSGATKVGGLLEASKSSDPKIIQPGVPTDVEYTITITNLDESTHQIQSLTDYLPPGFEYCTTSPPEPELYAVTYPACQLPSGITTSNPTEITIFNNGTPEIEDDRYRLYWEFSPAISIQENETLTLTFWAHIDELDISGSYYNEVIVVPNTPIPGIFQPDDMDVDYGDFNTTYSWNSGAVIVPAYDTSSEAEGVTINANMALIELGGITITSWGVY